jgi:hypothetical protein
MNTPSNGHRPEEAADKTSDDSSSTAAKANAKHSRDASKANPPLQHDIAGDLDQEGDSYGSTGESGNASDPPKGSEQAAVVAGPDGRKRAKNADAPSKPR